MKNTNSNKNNFTMSKLAVIKTKENNSSVEDFINSVKDEAKRKDSFILLKLMQKASKEKTENVGQLDDRFWK
jgi:hypothetical protein